ncbi:MAG: hypothetical protein K2H64_04100 [Desulfovibrio sp.]|nr:hypothetical protein [Desulfovibrio sp.]
MPKFIFLSLLAILLLPATGKAEIIGGAPIPPGATASRGYDVSLDYLRQAREYRDQGRYELSRQAYAQAISTCRNAANLDIIKREMAGVELLIRTMR